MAVFLDLENIALGAHDADFPAFDIRKVLERLRRAINAAAGIRDKSWNVSGAPGGRRLTN